VVLRPPGVPSLYAFVKDVEMPLVCHIAQLLLSGGYALLLGATLVTA
jgi:hypothetical protein